MRVAVAEAGDPSVAGFAGGVVEAGPAACVLLQAAASDITATMVNAERTRHRIHPACTRIAAR
ncbi:MAG TPA: hypothetical protein VH373_24790 [Jatrophihabitantaceae bacterium]